MQAGGVVSTRYLLVLRLTGGRGGRYWLQNEPRSWLRRLMQAIFSCHNWYIRGKKGDESAPDTGQCRRDLYTLSAYLNTELFCSIMNK